MASGMIYSLTEYKNEEVASSYGLKAYYTKQAGVRILHISGDASGDIGTSGHQFTVSNDVELPPDYLKICGFVGDHPFVITLNGRTVKITPLNGQPITGNPYINATFIY